MNIQYFLATTIIFEYIINIEYIQSSIYYTPTMVYIYGGGDMGEAEAPTKAGG